MTAGYLFFKRKTRQYLKTDLRMKVFLKLERLRKSEIILFEKKPVKNIVVI